MAEKIKGKTGPEETFSAAKPEEGHAECLNLSWCDLCYDDSSLKIKVDGFCQECNCFLCKACTDAHKKSPASRNHVLLRGAWMPKTQDDKPVKYPNCRRHIGKINNSFCIDHAEMVCDRCIESVHPLCKTKSVLDFCKELDAKDVNELKSHVGDIHRSIKATKSAFENNITDVEMQRKQVVKEIHNIRDQMIAKTEKMCSNMVSEVTNICNHKTSVMSHQLLQISDLNQSLQETISDIDKSTNAKFGPNLFMRIQDIVTNARHFENEIAELDQELKTVEVTFSINPEFLTFISGSKPLGQVIEKTTRLGTLKTTPKMAFPALPETSATGKARKCQINVSEIRPKKLQPLSIKIPDDRNDCKAEGMDVTSNGTLVVSDLKNKKVKVFSPKYAFLSAVSIPGKPYDVSVFDDTTAFATVDQEKRFVLDMTDPTKIYIDNSYSLGYFVTSLTTHDKKLVVVRWNEPRCVKMIRLDGQEVWSTMYDNTGQQLFKSPYSVATTEIDGDPIVLVTDWSKETLTFLNATNGRFVKKFELDGLGPRGLSLDGSGNMYICCSKTAEIRALSPDLKENRTVLSRTDLGPDPMDILYNDTTDEILVSYKFGDKIDRFKI